MIKINLEKKILSIRGNPVQNQELDDKGNPKTDKKGKRIMKDAVVRDYLLTILATRFPIIDKKETFWTTELGTLIASKTKIVNGKEVPNDILEISDDKAKFLRRIIENNKTKINLPMGGEKEIEIFFPYELGQLLKLFEGLHE